MADYSIYSRLKKLFSTNTVIRHTGGKKLRVVDTDNIQAFVNRRGVDRFNRVYSTVGGFGSHHGRAEAANAFHGARLQLFRDYDMMDNDPIISSVMDIYADESTVKNEFGQILSIRSKNSEIQSILHNLFYDILNIEFNLWMWTRNMCKYGDFFLYLDINESSGVVNVFPLSIYETNRVEGENPNNPFEVRFKIETDFLHLGKNEFDNYEIAHFRLLSDTNFLPYGKSAVEGGRRVWKQLQLMEDAMLIHRIMRAPDKRKFLVDVGNLAPAEIEPFMKRMMDTVKKAPLVDPRTGDYNLRFNMQNITEDIWIPVRGKNDGTQIQNLPGLQYNAIEDIEYLRNKLMAAFKVPKSFLGYEEDNSGKASLAAQDVRFARTIERIQRVLVSELTKIAIVHLYVLGFKDQELVEFELEMTNPSIVSEQEKINLWTQKIALANNLMVGKFFSREWIYTNILEISPEDAEVEYERMLEDADRIGELTRLEQEALMGAQGGQVPSQPGVAQDPTQMQGMPQQAGAVQQQQPNDAEQQILNLDQALSGLGEPDPSDDDIIKEAKVGRPKEVVKYGTDKHPRGRDPVGARVNANALKGTITPMRNPRFPTSKLKVSTGAKMKLISTLRERFKQRQEREESARAEPQMLSESNIMDDSEE